MPNSIVQTTANIFIKVAEKMEAERTSQEESVNNKIDQANIDLSDLLTSEAAKHEALINSVTKSDIKARDAVSAEIDDQTTTFIEGNQNINGIIEGLRDGDNENKERLDEVEKQVEANEKDVNDKASELEALAGQVSLEDFTSGQTIPTPSTIPGEGGEA